MACDVTVRDFVREVGTLEVSAKYKQLMLDSLSSESLYIRAKDTFKVIFDDLELTTKERAAIVSEHVANMTTSLSGAAMSSALQWAKEERDGAYSLAKLKADTEVSIAQALKMKEEICLAQKQTELQCANIIATLSGTIRENGMYATDADGCKVLSVDNTGLKYAQTRQVDAATYQAQADAFRKSGVVDIGIDLSDGVTKGVSGSIDPITSGYTCQQTLNAERQRIAYEDSKRTHAANSASAMIGQLLSSETFSADNAADVERWRTAMDALNTSHSSTSDL